MALKTAIKVMKPPRIIRQQEQIMALQKQLAQL